MRKFALRSLFFFNLCKLPDLLWNLQFKILNFNFNALLKTLLFPGFPKGSIWSTDMPSLTSHTERNSVLFSFDRSIKNQDMTDTCVKTCPNFQTSLWKKSIFCILGFWKVFFLCDCCDLFATATALLWGLKRHYTACCIPEPQPASISARLLQPLLLGHNPQNMQIGSTAQPLMVSVVQM